MPPSKRSAKKSGSPSAKRIARQPQEERVATSEEVQQAADQLLQMAEVTNELAQEIRQREKRRKTKR